MMRKSQWRRTLWEWGDAEPGGHDVHLWLECEWFVHGKSLPSAENIGLIFHMQGLSIILSGII